MTAARPPERQFRRNRPVFSRLGLLFLIGLCVLFVSSYTHRLMRKAEVEREIAEWDQRIAEAERHQQELQAELDYVNSPAYIEDVARNQLDMAREGDRVIIVLAGESAPESNDSSGSAENETATSISGIPEEATWRQWVDLLSGED